MFGSGLGFILEQPNRGGSGGGGGGGTTYFADRAEVVYTAPFASGVTVALPNTPFDPDACLVFYNGVKVRPGAGGYTIASNIITLNFGDDPTLYDDGQCVLEVNYMYT